MMTGSLRDFGLLLFLWPALGWSEAKLTLRAGDSLLAGEPPGIAVAGADAGEHVRVHSFRSQQFSENVGGKYVTKYTTMHASAEFVADAEGSVDVDRQAPVSGTYPGMDARGLLWSGTAEGESVAKPPFQALTIQFRLERKGAMVDSKTVTFRFWNEDVEFTRVETAGLTGMFAAPKDAKKLPVVLVLHGSEGGTFEAAKRDAGLLASHGFATLSVIYFAWAYSGIPNVPQAFDNLPVERIAMAREWLAARPEADVNRLGIRGSSKGAEFALLAASEYPWVHAVAACVPSSLVWGPFGASVADGKEHSGFTLSGKPLANVPYGDYAPVQAGKMTLTERHILDRAAVSAEVVSAARIPVERSEARFLLSGSGEDEVWPSREMAQEVAARLKPVQVQTQFFPRGGHYICGTGSFPARSPNGGGTPGGGDAVEVGRAAGMVWDETLSFLKSAL